MAQQKCTDSIASAHLGARSSKCYNFALLGKTLYSHSSSLDLGVWMGTDNLSCKSIKFWGQQLLPREKVQDTQGLLFFLSWQDLWIVIATSFSSQDKWIPPPLLPLEVLPFSQSVKKSKWNDNICISSCSKQLWKLHPNSTVLIKKKMVPVMFSKNDLLQSSFQSTTQKKALSHYYLIQYLPLNSQDLIVNSLL